MIEYMDNFKDALKNKAPLKDLVGLKMEEIWQAFHYNTETGELVCNSEKNLAEYKSLAEAELDKLKRMTPEDYRDELIENARKGIERCTAVVEENRTMYQQAKEKRDEIMAMEFPNEAVNFAARDLISTLNIIANESKMRAVHMEKSMDRLNDQLEMLTEWSDETRAEIAESLANKIRETKDLVQKKSAIWSRAQMEKEAVEVFNEIFGDSLIHKDSIRTGESAEEHDR